MNKFNLIVSTHRFGEEDAQDEIHQLLEEFGDPDAESEITEITGIILVQTALDPLHVTGRLKELISSEPWQVRYILRVLPIEEVVPTEMEDIKNAAAKLASRIEAGDTFRITVEKRHSTFSSMEVIKEVAGEIKGKVDLESPGWVVLVQIVGGRTGVSVIRPDQTFSSVVEKRGL